MELNLYWIFEQNEKVTSLYWSLVSLLLVGSLGFLDYLTGPRINISLYYLVPIVLATWVVHQNAGLFISFLSALTGLVAAYASVTCAAAPASLVHLINLVDQVGKIISINIHQSSSPVFSS